MAKLKRVGKSGKGTSYSMECNGRSVGTAYVTPDRESGSSMNKYLLEIEVESPKYKYGMEYAETRAEAEEILRGIAAGISCGAVRLPDDEQED